MQGVSGPFDVRLPQGDEPEEMVRTVVQPDLTVVCDHAKLDDKGCLGAPDLVIEILSPRTAAKDMKIKLDLYERSGSKNIGWSTLWTGRSWCLRCKTLGSTVNRQFTTGAIR